MTKIELCRRVDNILFRMAADQNEPIKPFKSTVGSYVGFVDCEPFLSQYEKGEYPSLSVEDIAFLVEFIGRDSSEEDSELGCFNTTIFQHIGTGYFVALRSWVSLPERRHCDKDGFIYCYPINVKFVKKWERENA